MFRDMRRALRKTPLLSGTGLKAPHHASTAPLVRSEWQHIAGADSPKPSRASIIRIVQAPPPFAFAT